MHAFDAPIRDEDLIAQTVGGSREAFGFLVIRHGRSVRSVCLAKIGNHRDLDDMVQECFLRAYRSLPKLRKRSRFSGYVRRIARNICTDWLRKRDREPVSLDEVDLNLGDAEGTATRDADDAHVRLRQAVGRLPEGMREAVFMYYFEDMNIQEMSELLGITSASVSQRLARARARMGEELRMEMNPS